MANKKKSVENTEVKEDLKRPVDPKGNDSHKSSNESKASKQKRLERPEEQGYRLNKRGKKIRV